MFTYGYIKEAVLAHIDLNESEASNMNLFVRLYIYINEAIQAICANKPKYKYFEANVISKYKPVVSNGNIIREATDDEIARYEANMQLLNGFAMLNNIETKSYYNSNNIYVVDDIAIMPDEFIAFTDRQAWKYVDSKVMIIDGEYKILKEKTRAKVNYDFSYSDKNTIKFHKIGKYEIPMKCMWTLLNASVSENDKLDLPTDIALTIPLYVASICLQIDNPKKADVKRSEFELALARCTSTDFMELNRVSTSW